MAVKLIPRVYGKDLAWNILPKNAIDTITMKPILNDLVESDVNVTEITEGVVNGETYSLPLENKNSLITHSKYGYNQGKSAWWSAIMADYAVEMVMFKGTYDIDLEAPITGTPTISFELEGEVMYLTRGEKTVDEIRAGHTNGTMYVFIEDNAGGSESIVNNKIYDTTNRANLNEGLILDLNQGWLPNFAWVTRTTGSVPENIVPEGTFQYWETYDYLNSPYRPKEYEILTKWANDDTDSWIPNWNNWYQEGSNFVRQGPYSWPLFNTDQYYSRFVPIKNDKVPISCTVVKINEYKLRVEYSIPVRYGYLAAANAVGRIVHTHEYARDSYGYMFKVSKIIITTKAYKTDEDSTELSYSRLNDNELTTEVTNNNPLSFEENPFITMHTYYRDNSESEEKDKNKLWTTYMSQLILNRYKNGKYIVECSIPIWWAMQHNIGINSKVKVKLQDGTFIRRGEDVCIFQVKTIEKVFKDSSFNYSIRLLEMYREIEYEQFVSVYDEIFIEADGKNFMVIKGEEDGE